MRVVFDIEANALVNPTKIWCIVCKDIDTGEYHIFREVTDDQENLRRFVEFSRDVSLWIGHNVLGYDIPVVHSLCDIRLSQALDTLILSKLIDYPRKGHSIEDYGIEFGLPKGEFTDFSKYSPEMEQYCIRDVDIAHKIYLKYLKYLSKEEHKQSIQTEHDFQELVVNALHENGFSFNSLKAGKLLDKIKGELDALDKEIEVAFPDKLRLVREIHPKLTKYGTLNRSDFRWVADTDLTEFNGGPFCRCNWERFNPSSHKQLIEILNSAGWSPTDKTQTRIDDEREYARLKHLRSKEQSVDLRAKELYTKLQQSEITGWKINEVNLNTLPPSAPSPARTLAKRILLEARRRTLTEWLGLVQSDERIHGKFYGIGAWTHRMAHQQPNTANIPNEFDTQGNLKLYGKEMRSLWQAPRNRLLVGVDAEGIQLRIFAHYINDPEFTEALVNGRKQDKSDPHSLNQRIMGPVCRSRAAAKRFIYALLLGAGIGKLAEILKCNRGEAEEALDRLTKRYTGFAYLKREVIPSDAKRGWFTGLDGRKVSIPGAGVGERRHLAMSGYLQNGEAVVMKMATLLWIHQLKDYDAQLVNLVHDEWQTEVPNNLDIAMKVAKLQADSLRTVGERLNLRCPLAGSYYNEDIKDYTINTNWAKTH